MPRPRRETALYRANALLPLLLVLGQGVLVRSQTVVGVDSCEDLKSTIEGSGTSDEQLIVQVQEGSSQIVCREGIYVALGQSIRVEGVSDRDVPTEFFLDAEGIYDSSGDGSAVGILFENDGDLELYNLAFLLDYVLPEDETTTTTTIDTTDSTYGVRIVQNSGAVNMTDCRIAGSRSMANQAYVLGQAVNSQADSASVFVSGLTYDNLSPSGSVIRAIGVSDVTIEDSSFYSGSDFAPSTGFGSEGSIVNCASDVELSVTGSTFQSRPESIAGGASISCVGGTVRDCRFIGQYASQEGGGTVYSAVDSGSDRPLVIESSVFEGNIADTSASCVAVHDRNMTIRSSQFTGNEGTPVLFESSSPTGEHQLLVEGTEFTGNYETTDGDLGSYNGGSAVVVRNTGAEEETFAVTSGSFTDTVCETNIPSTCEIVLDASQVTLLGSSTCLVCDGDSTFGDTTPSPLLSPSPSPSPSPASFLLPTPAPTFYPGTTNPAGTLSPLYSGGTLNPASTLSPLYSGGTLDPAYVTTTMMTMAPTSSPTQSPTPVPSPVEDPVAACGQNIFNCEALKRAVEYDGRENRTEACGFYIAMNITCSSSITIASGMDIEINGLTVGEIEELNATTTSAADDDVSATVRQRRRRLLPSGSVGGTNDSRSWLFAGNGCCDEDDGATVDSLFVVESGGSLTLIDLGFQDATTSANVRNSSVRAVHTSGELYVDGCDFVGPASTDVNERGGAIYSEGEILSITSSSFCNFTAWRSGGAVHVSDVVNSYGSSASVTIRSTSFAKNGALASIPGSGGGAMAVMEGPVLEVTECSFEDNYGRLGAAVLCSGGEFDGSVFVGGNSQTEDQGNGGLRSAGGGYGLTVNNCSFVNVTAGTYDSVAPGSALQVLDSNLTVTESTFEGCTGTPLYMETNSPNGSPYYLQVESTVFSSNTDPGMNGTSGAAAEINAANGTEIDNGGGGEALDMTCEGNVPSQCEVVTASGATSMLFDIGVGCHVCDGQGVTVAGFDNSTGEITYTAETGEELKSLIDSGLSGTFRLVNDISIPETITIIDGQTVTITSASSDGTPLYYSINPAAPFNGTNSAAAAAAAAATDNASLIVAAAGDNDDDYGADSDSLFVVEPGASLTCSALVLNATVLSSGVNSSNDGSNGLVRAIYNGGNATAEDCTFLGTGEDGTDGGAIYNSITATYLTVSDSSLSGLSVTGSGGAIYAAENTTVTLIGNSFEQNGAGSSGGCVFAEWGAALEVQGGSFQESSAPEGAAIAFCGGVVTGVTVVSCNTTEEKNGAVVSGESDGDDCPYDLDVSDAIFEDNSGGGLAGFDTNVNVMGCNFTGNTGTAVYFETSDGFQILVEDARFVNNSKATDWSTDDSQEEGGSDMVVLSSSSSGEAEGSTATLSDVTCSASGSSSSTCTVIVDEESFALSTESVACGVCNLEGTAVNSTATDLVTSSSGAWGWRRILAVVLPIVLALLLCCCCCLYYANRGKQWKRKKGRRHYLFNYPSMNERWGPEETPRPPSSSSGGNSRPSSEARGGGDEENVTAAAAADFGDEYERMMLARAEAEAEVPDAKDVPPLVTSNGKSMVVYTEGEDDGVDFDIDEDIKRQVEEGRAHAHVAFAPPEKEQDGEDELEVKKEEDGSGEASGYSTTTAVIAAAAGAAAAVVAASATGGDAADVDATRAAVAAGARAAKEDGETRSSTVAVVSKTGAEEPYVEDVDDDEESAIYRSSSDSGDKQKQQQVAAAATAGIAEGGKKEEAVATVVPMAAVLATTGQGRRKEAGSSATSSAVLSSSSSDGVAAKEASSKTPGLATVPLPTPTHVCMSTFPRAYPPAEAAMSQSSSEGSVYAGDADDNSGDGQAGGRILPQAHSFLPAEGEMEDLEEARRTGETHQ